MKLSYMREVLLFSMVQKIKYLMTRILHRCGSLNVTSTHKLIRNGTIKSCGFKLGGGVWW